jgi:transposase
LCRLGRLPRPEGTTLDRFPDKAGDYEPSNCRWATPKEQAANTKRAVLLEAFGETHNIAEWARIRGLNRTTVQLRLKQGLTAEEALDTALRPSQLSFAEGRARGKKLTSESVSQIVELAQTGHETGTSLAKQFGVSQSSILQVLRQYGIRLKKGRPKNAIRN